MKKFMLLAIVAMFATINVFADNEVVNNDKTTTISTDDYTCIEVKGVTGELNVGEGKIYFFNYNDFSVNVSWTVYATHVNTGKETRFASGNLFIGPKVDSYGYNATSAYITTSSNYEAYSLDMRVEYCK